MDPRYSERAETFRAHVRSFLAEQLPPGWPGIGALPRDEALEFTRHWRSVLHDHGLLAPAWPTEYGGGGLGKLEQVVLVEELARAGVPAMGLSDNFGMKMLGGLLLRWGTDEQKRRLLPRILSGDDVWCQGYSEPDSGSDLASLRTSAVRDGDEWVISGQKTWTSRAQDANWIFVLARTNPDVPTHQGITVRPIETMGRDPEFNEVFFDGARTALDSIVGDVDNGWTVANSLLGLERGDEAATNPVLFRAEFDRLVEMARELGRLHDPVIRDRLAAAYARVETMRFLGYRILTGVLSSGTIGPEASISKLYWSEYHRDLTRLALDVLGAQATVVEGRAPIRAYRADDPGARNTSASWLGTFFNGVAGTIYAGTSEVQRNILAERVLGLPREPRPS